MNHQKIKRPRIKYSKVFSTSENMLKNKELKLNQFSKN